jgi:hypothetical protein
METSYRVVDFALMAKMFFGDGNWFELVNGGQGRQDFPGGSPLFLSSTSIKTAVSHRTFFHSSLPCVLVLLNSSNLLTLDC